MAEKRMSKKEEQLRKQRRSCRMRRFLVIFFETVLLVILAVGCYGVNILNTVQRSDTGDVYIAEYETESMTAETKAETKEAVDQKEEEETKASTASVVAVKTEDQEDEEDSLLSAHDTMNGYWPILIVGVDARANADLTQDTNADVIIIAAINTTTKEVKMASIYRDTLLKMYSPDKHKAEYMKANEGMQVSVSEMLSMINMNLGMQIQDVVVVNWAAVALAINNLGGIDVEVTEVEIEKAYLQGYITYTQKATGIPTTQITQAGLQHVDGIQAVAWCRNRYGGNLDYGRTERQRYVIEQMLMKAKEASLGTLLSTVTTVFSNIYTTLDNTELMSLASDVASYTIGESCGFPFNLETAEYVGRIFEEFGVKDPIVAVDFEANVQQLHQFLYGTSEYPGASTIHEISERIKEVSGVQ